jgi:acetyl-CoA carboxylase biotin carboxyl carrier protein
MDLRKIKKLIDLLEESNLTEIEIREGEESVRLSRAPRTAPAPAPVYLEAPRAAAPLPAQGLVSPMATWCARRWSAPSTPRPTPTPRRS